MRRPCFPSNTPEPHLPGGAEGGAAVPGLVSVVPTLAFTCGCAAARLSGEIIPPPAPGPLNTHSSPASVCESVCVCACARLHQSGPELQSQAADEQMKHRWNETRKATLPIERRGRRRKTPDLVRNHFEVVFP